MKTKTEHYNENRESAIRGVGIFEIMYRCTFGEPKWELSEEEKQKLSTIRETALLSIELKKQEVAEWDDFLSTFVDDGELYHWWHIEYPVKYQSPYRD